ncbi:unnamed protein product [Urochloa decumbens]|uniref:Uncharacterized protein n=1 Tax=Urochloa decumbens TaxID=240449 RepID=A0ABC8Z4S1_9POAL
MEEEEARLRFALIAQVGNASREFSSADVSRAVAEATNLDVSLFPAVPTFPESFLVVCSTQEARDRALAASPVAMAATFLSLRPWTRLVRATSRTLYHKVGIEMDGISEHAWDLDTASRLLARHAWVERLDPVTVSKADMSTFKLTAWTKDPFGIPADKTLCIAEPEPRIDYPDEERRRIFTNVVPYLRQKIVMEYPISIHLRSIADFSSRTPSSSESSPSEDGDSGPDGNPDRSYGFRSGVGPRISGFRRRRGGGGGGTVAGAVNDDPRRNGSQRPSGTGSKDGGPSGALADGPQKAVSNRGVATTTVNTIAAVQDVATVQEASPMDGQPVPVSPAATGKPAALAEDLAVQCIETKRREEDKPYGRSDPMQFESLLRPNDAMPATLGGKIMEDPAAFLTELQGPWVPPSETEPNNDPMIVDAAPPHCDRASMQPADASATGASQLGLLVGSTSVGSKSVEREAGSPTCPPTTVEDEARHDDDPGSSSPPGFSRALGYGPAARQQGDPATSTDDTKLRAFTFQVRSKLRSPLAPRPARTKRTATATDNGVPKRSSRLANHPLANVPSAKRAEVVLMHRFELIPEPTAGNTESKKAYDKLYKEGLLHKNMEAMRDIMPALRNASPILGMQA